MRKHVQKLDENQKIMALSFIWTLALIFLTLPLSFINLYGVPLGFLLGGAIGVVNFWLLVRQSHSLMNPLMRHKFIDVLSVSLRYAIYGAGLFLAAILTKYGINIFNVFAVLGGYLLIRLVIIFYFGKKNREVKDNVTQPSTK